MKELFNGFQVTFKEVPVPQDVQYAFQLMRWMGSNFPNKSIKELMGWVANNQIKASPEHYQMGQAEELIDTGIPFYEQRGWTHYIMVPTGFKDVLNLPYRMQPVMFGLVEAASQMRWTGQSRYLDHHQAEFMRTITNVLV